VWNDASGVARKWEGNNQKSESSAWHVQPPVVLSIYENYWDGANVSF